MIKSYNLSPRLRDVVDFEVDYIKRFYDEKISEKKRVLAEMDRILTEKDREISILKAKLKENGIQ